MDYKDITEKYYSKWVGCDINSSPNGEITYIYNRDRNIKLRGYPRPFDLYIYYQSSKIIISYGDKVKDKLAYLKNTLTTYMSVDNIKDVIKSTFYISPKHIIKFIYHELPTISNDVKTLRLSDYHYFREFFAKNNPNAKYEDWLEDYFIEISRENFCCGIFKDNILVSCTDAPSMPYIKGNSQEIGINTLEEFRGNGYATDCCIKCAQNIIAQGKCPQWSTTIDNIASQKLVFKVGFIKYADVLTISL